MARFISECVDPYSEDIYSEPGVVHVTSEDPVYGHISVDVIPPSQLVVHVDDQRADLRKTTTDAMVASVARAISRNARFVLSAQKTANPQRTAPSPANMLIVTRRAVLNRSKSDRQVLRSGLARRLTTRTLTGNRSGRGSPRSRLTSRLRSSLRMRRRRRRSLSRRLLLVGWLDGPELPSQRASERQRATRPCTAGRGRPSCFPTSSAAGR
jgi:hypothetical protein